MDTTIAERVFLFSLQISNHDLFAIPIITVIISFTLIQRLCIAWLAFLLSCLFSILMLRGTRRRSRICSTSIHLSIAPKKTRKQDKRQKKKKVRHSITSVFTLLECLVCIFWRSLFWVLGPDHQVRIRRNINFGLKDLFCFYGVDLMAPGFSRCLDDVRHSAHIFRGP